MTAAIDGVIDRQCHATSRGSSRASSHPCASMHVYMRDRDGRRVELFNTHYQIMDIEDEPVALAGTPAIAKDRRRIRPCGVGSLCRSVTPVTAGP